MKYALIHCSDLQHDCFDIPVFTTSGMCFYGSFYALLLTPKQNVFTIKRLDQSTVAELQRTTKLFRLQWLSYKAQPA